MSQRTKVVGTRALVVWLLIIIAVVVVAALAVGGLVVYPRFQEQRAEQARLAEVERHYQAAVAFQDVGDWVAAEAEYKQVVTFDADYKDAKTRLAEVKARLAENEATATAVAIAQAEQARADAQATATAQAQATATTKASAIAATAEVLEAQYQRGLGYINREKWAEAKAELEQVFVADPNYKEAQAMRAEVEAKLEELSIPTATLTPTPTDTPLPGTPTPKAVSPTFTPTPYPEGAGPTGDWAVRSYNTDDLGVIFVNDKLVGASTHYKEGHDDTGWIAINDLLVPGQDTVVAFASSNDGGADRRWGFSVRRNDVALWGSEESLGGGPKTLSYAQQVAIRPDGSVKAVPPDTSAWTPPPGKWYVRVQDVDDVGAILVNGVPVAAVHAKRDSDWVEITGQLYSDRDNTVTVASWNFDADYAWKFSIKRDDTIVWSKESAGSGAVDLVFDEQVTISSQGEIVLPPMTGGVKAQTWAVRSYNTDDLGVIFVNDKLVGASTHYKEGHDDTGWIAINDLLVPGQDTVVAFASSNDGGADRRWGFLVRRNEVALWGSEESPGGGPKTLSYVQQVAIHPDGSVKAVSADTSVRTPLPGKWYARVQDVDDVGAILVNGMPVAAVHAKRDSGWVEITGQLYSDRDNTVTVAAWNFDADYAWKFSIKRDDTIVWAVEKSGSGLTGLTLSERVTISDSGELIAP